MLKPQTGREGGGRNDTHRSADVQRDVHVPHVLCFAAGLTLSTLPESGGR